MASEEITLYHLEIDVVLRSGFDESGIGFPNRLACGPKVASSKVGPRQQTVAIAHF